MNINKKIPSQLHQQVWLAIHYHFPPAGMVAGFRNYEIVKNIEKKVKNLHVLTGRHEASTQNSFLDTSHFNIHKIPNWDYRIFFKKANSFKSKKNNTTPKKTKFRRRLLDSFPTNLLIGEGGLIYIIMGIFKACRLVRRHDVTHIYSSYRPYADHVIAWWVKLFFPSVYWVADFGDIQIDPVLKNVYWTNFQHWCNRKILAKADLVTTVSAGLGKALQKYHTNIFILKNGIVELPSMPIDYMPSSKKHFTISYTGALYGERTALPLMKVLKKLLDTQQIDATHLEIVYAGNDFNIWAGWARAYQLDAFLKNKGLVSLTAARALQRSSQINVMLSWASPELTGWLTFKLYDYLLAGKPILSIVNGHQDPELEEVLHQHEAGQVFYAEAENQRNLELFILDHYQAWLKGIRQTAQQYDLTAYEWKTMVGEMLEKISN